MYKAIPGLNTSAFWLLGGLLLSCFSLFSQKEAPVAIIHYGFEEGLSSLVITHILEHSSGLVWAGTKEGLTRYDGYEFKLFENQPGDPSSINGRYVQRIFEWKDCHLNLITYSLSRKGTDVMAMRCIR